MRGLCLTLLVAVVACGCEPNDDTGSTQAGSTTGTTGTTGGGGGEYTAFYVAGPNTMYKRIAVRRVHVADDLCTNVSLISPLEQNPEGFTIALPAMWVVEHAGVLQGAADCLTVYQLPGKLEFAQSGAGSAAWSPETPCPTAVDIDVTLEFAQDLPWVPAQDTLQASGIPVQGC